MRETSARRKPPKRIVVMPAYNAARTLEVTYRNLPAGMARVILCDDGSSDDTVAVARELGITTITHSENRGYGANQKTLYDAALRESPDVVVMVHPDNQYETSRVPEMVSLVARGAGLVLGTRMHHARENGMPWWKRLGNRFLTTLENLAFGTALSEFHSGLRAYDAALLREMPYRTFSDDFVFDSEAIAWTVANGYRLEEVPADCFYTPHASSVDFRRSVRYGFATLSVLVRYRLGRYRRSERVG